MNQLAFFDTNILVYTDDRSAPAKQETAITLYTQHRGAGTAVVSVQVLQEYFAAATRKLGMDAETAQRKVELIARGRVVRLREDDVIAAIELHRLTRLPFWDALIVQAARRAGASLILSEDWRHGSTLGGIRIVNPFR
jgi:predicted nucleic acid-binding protein